MNHTPKFIVFEGIDGAGKTTQISLLCRAFETRGIAYMTTLEPTELPSGKLLRRALSGETPKTPTEMAKMFATDRKIHNTHPTEGIGVMLEKGISVISDRYYYSSLAYQGAALGYEAVAKLNLEDPDIRRPDLCVFLDLTPEKSLERIGSRGEKTEIYENLDYLTRTRAMFFDVFDRLKEQGERIEIIDASGSVEEVSAQVISAVLKIYQ
ncbi:MAG: dTMP kinase [Clostridia bacterium]|nr:dTMP kinase [Clostridia bacterium]